MVGSVVMVMLMVCVRLLIWVRLRLECSLDLLGLDCGLAFG